MTQSDISVRMSKRAHKNFKRFARSNKVTLKELFEIVSSGQSFYL